MEKQQLQIGEISGENWRRKIRAFIPKFYYIFLPKGARALYSPVWRTSGQLCLFSAKTSPPLLQVQEQVETKKCSAQREETSSGSTGKEDTWNT